MKADLFPPPALGKYLPEMFSIEAVWIPFAVPYRLPKPGERWFPPLLKVPEVFALNKGEVGIETTYSDVRLPARSLGNSQYAALVKAHVGRADLVASFYDGFDRNPAAEITGSLVTTASGFLRAKPPHVDLDLDVRFLMDRIRTAGGGFSIPVWDFTVKGDFAYIQGRLANFDIASPADLLKRDPENLWRIEKEFIGNLCAGKLDQTISIGQVPVSVEKDFFSIGVQVEYLTGRWVFDVAAYEDFMFRWVQGLILPQYETRVVLNVRRTFLDEVLTVEAPVVVDASTGDVLTLPQATYAIYDDLKATAGAIAIWGASDHLLGQFHRNDEVFAKLVFSF